MKYLIQLLIVITCLTIFKSNAQDAAYFGKQIDEHGAITMKELLIKMKGQDALPVKVTGKIVESCKVKGCWMTIDHGNGSAMRVKFKDYAFFVPKDSEGKTAIIEGTAMMKTTSVEELKHYALDAGKSKEEIEAITQPESQLIFEAEGVILK
jgi:hypothetical protein